MKFVPTIIGVAAMLGLAAFTLPSRATPAPTTHSVKVHCPAGGHAGFVTPSPVHVVLGDAVKWSMTGQVMSDSIIISLKDSTQTWPFAGSPSHGGTSATASNAAHAGHYGYNVTLLCRVAGGGTQRAVIDPDIIIQ